MTPKMRAALGFAGIVVLVLAQNALGSTLNDWFMALPGIDKVLHFVEFTLVFVFVAMLLRRAVSPTGRRLTVVWVLGLGLALGDELAQSFTSFRNVEGLDLMADLAGLTVGWVLVSPFRIILLVPLVAAVSVASYATYDTNRRLIDFTRALNFERENDFVTARHHLHLALARGLRSAALFNELSWVEIESGVGDPAKAVEWAETALGDQPTNPDFLDTYGWALHHAGRSEDGQRVLERARALNPDIYSIHYHLGVVYSALGQRDKAVAHLREQLTRPDTREAGFARRTLLEMGIDPEPR